MKEQGFLDRVVRCVADRLDHVPDGAVDAWVTSPPFEKMRRYSDDPADLGNFQGPEFVERLIPVIREWRRTLKTTGNLFLNFMPQTIGGALSPTAWLLPQALAENGFAIVQTISIVKTNAMPGNEPRLLKPAVEVVYHAVKDPASYVVEKDAVRRPSLWAARDNRPWKYRDGGADGGNFIAPALERLNRMAVKDVLAMVCADDANTLFIAKTQDQAVVHPARMADEVAEWLVRYGSPEGGVVGDNFVGSGTTAIAAKRLGRHYVASDLDDEYVAQAEAALEGVEFGQLLGAAGMPAAPSRDQGPASRPPVRPLPRKESRCLNCGRRFPPARRSQLFCKPKCRFDYHNERRRSHGEEEEAHPARGG